MTKHTPGPWTCRRANKWWSTDDWDYPVFLDGDSDSIAIAADGEVVAFSSCATEDWDSTQCDANAYLIAAAPELLEALENLIDHVAFIYNYKDLMDLGDIGSSGSVRIALEAIAKAKGEQP